MFRNGSFAKVWDVRTSEKGGISARISTSFKKDDGTYEQDFGGWITFVGSAKEMASSLSKGESIRLEKVMVGGNYEKETGKANYRFIVSEYSIGNSNGNSTASAPTTMSEGFMNIPDDIDDELPFN